jgi:hypothetical protein
MMALFILGMAAVAIGPMLALLIDDETAWRSTTTPGARASAQPDPPVRDS